MVQTLKSFTLLLASSSARRKELIKGLDMAFRIVEAPQIDESYPPTLTPSEIPPFLARLKSQAYSHPLLNGEILLTADTLVVCRGRILGKPKDAAQAKEYLHWLSNNAHQVYTGVCLRSQDKQSSFCVETSVYFKALENSEIDYYIDTYKPFDKAGAYGVQEWIGYTGIQKIEGSYYNVMGLPVQRLYEELKLFCR